MRITLLRAHKPQQSTKANDNLELCIVSMMRERKRLKNLQKDRYVNCDFIIGSTTEVERIFSVRKVVRSSNRKGLTRVIFEAIMLLKTNKEFWNIELVIQAMKNNCSAKFQATFNQGSEQIEIE